MDTQESSSIELICDDLPDLTGQLLRPVIVRYFKTIAILKSEHSWESIAEYLYAKGVRPRRSSGKIKEQTLRHYWNEVKSQRIASGIHEDIQKAKRLNADAMASERLKAMSYFKAFTNLVPMPSHTRNDDGHVVTVPRQQTVSLGERPRSESVSKSEQSKRSPMFLNVDEQQADEPGNVRRL